MYEVIVGNVGTVYQGDNRAEADRLFDTYVLQSNMPYGRASGESVTMLGDDDIVKESFGWLSLWENDDELPNLELRMLVINRQPEASAANRYICYVNGDGKLTGEGETPEAAIGAALIKRVRVHRWEG